MPETPTTRLGLYKPLNDGSENVDVQQDLNDNWDKVDPAVGFQIVTSGTRPAAPYAGKPIAESDTTYRTYFSNGTAPASASWVEIPNSSASFNGNLNMELGKQLNVGGSASTAAYAIRLSSATADYCISSRAVGDSFSRFTGRADGRLGWGSGTVDTDTFLARSGTAALSLTGSLTTSGAVTVGGDLTVTGIGQTLFARKTANTGRTSTTTATSDTHLTMSVAANAVYTVEAFLVFDGDIAGDFKAGFTAPASSTGAYSLRGPDLSATAGTTASLRFTALTDFTTQIPAGAQGVGTNSSASLIGTLVTAGTAGTFALQWAQNTSSATATTLMANSWLRLKRVA